MCANQRTIPEGERVFHPLGIVERPNLGDLHRKLAQLNSQCSQECSGQDRSSGTPTFESETLFCPLFAEPATSFLNFSFITYEAGIIKYLLRKVAGIFMN